MGTHSNTERKLPFKMGVDENEERSHQLRQLNSMYKYKDWGAIGKEDASSLKLNGDAK
jgi:hypothetical protein